MKRNRRDHEEGEEYRRRPTTKSAVRGSKPTVIEDVRVAALGPDPPPHLSVPATSSALFADIQDWAREEDEEPQTYADWLHMQRYAPDSKRDTIYLLPLGINEQPSPESDDDDSDGKRKRKRKRTKKEEEEEEEYDLQFDEVHPAAPTIAQLAEFVAAFFRGLKVKIMPPLSFVKEKGGVYILAPPYQYPIKTKKSKTFGNERLYDMDVLRVIKGLLPKDGFCVVAITARDIYEHPRDDGEIVLGRGTGDRVGVISLYHHGKPQGGATNNRKKSVSYSAEEKRMWKLRTCKTMAHEMCHIFGIDHCVYYTCLMNAHASPDGQDNAEALHLCPIDLRKLGHSIGFDIGERYRQLATYYAREGWREEAEWMAQRIKHLPTPPTTMSPPPARGQDAEEEEQKGAAATDPT